VTTYYCRPCTLHDRQTLRDADETPTDPCEHNGTGPDDCKRVEWVERNFFCLTCSRVGVTHVHYGDPSGATCPEGHAGPWGECEDSRYAFSARRVS
jgi:hypothetical protein